MLEPGSRLTSMSEEIALATRSPQNLVGDLSLKPTTRRGRDRAKARDRDRPTTTKGETHEHDNV